MHSIILAATLLVAGITALPRCNHQNLPRQLEAARGQISNYILGSMVSEILRNFIDSFPELYELPEQQIISYSTPDGSTSVYCVVDGLRVSGIRDIVINSIDVSILRPAIVFDVTAPQIQASAASALCDIKLAGYTLSTVGSGTIIVYDLNITGRAAISLIPSLRVNDVNADVTIGDINADTVGEINGFDSTQNLDDFLNNNLLPLLINESNAVNSLANAVLLDIFNAIFN